MVRALVVVFFIIFFFSCSHKNIVSIKISRNDFFGAYQTVNISKDLVTYYQIKEFGNSKIGTSKIDTICKYDTVINGILIDVNKRMYKLMQSNIDAYGEPSTDGVTYDLEINYSNLTHRDISC